jgi:uncharacterized membrane protein YhaH (DUF805 family)
MFDTIGMSFSKYVDFKGRATRKEFWTFYAFTFVAAFVLAIIEGAMGISGLSNLVILATVIPSISCGVRRMHDAGKSGWFILVPLYNFILLCTPSKPEITPPTTE